MVKELISDATRLKIMMTIIQDAKVANLMSNSCTLRISDEYTD